MHFPVIFTIFSEPVRAHLLCEILAYTLGFQYYLYLRRQSGDFLNDNKRIWVIIGGILGASFFSKLLGCLEHPEMIALTRQNLIYFMASKTIVGGVLGGVIGVETAKKLMGISRSTGDIFCFPLILGIMIGRLGCFLEGVSDDTWGSVTDSIFGMYGGDSMPHHPTPLYEIVALAFIWGTLLMLRNKFRLKEGSLFKLFMVMYLTWRLGIEFIKPVHVIAPLGLSSIQIACVIGLLYYHRTIFRFRSLIEA